MLGKLVIRGLSGVAIWLIGIYRRWVSPFTPPSCRYFPTCSTYSLMLFRLTSPWYALFFSIIRISKCNPLFKGGYDYPCLWVKIENVYFAPQKIVYWMIPRKECRAAQLFPKTLKMKVFIILT